MTPQLCVDTDQSTNIDTPKPPPGYGNNLGDRSPAESFSNHQQNTSTPSFVGKWPLKPGVLVHSKQQLIKSSTNVTETSNNIINIKLVENNTFNDTNKVKSKIVNGSCKGKLSVEVGLPLINETQSARVARIRRMMIGANCNNIERMEPYPTSPPPTPPVRHISDNVNKKYNPSVTGRQLTNKKVSSILNACLNYILINKNIYFI